MKKVILWIGLIFLAALFLMLALNSCSVLKSKQQKQSDTAHVHNIDSGAIKKNTNSEKNTSDWERQIVIYNRDTTINNYIATNAKPAVVVYERGSNQQEKQGYNYDSVWNKKLDSLQVIFKESTKQKKEQVLSIWQIIGISVGVGIVFILASKLKLSLK